MRKSDAFVAERRKQMVAMVNKEKNISIHTLAHRFSMSLSTARKQLALLEDQGLIVRTHGGASRIEPATPYSKTELWVQDIENYPEKKALTQSARAFVKDGDVIGICGGTTLHMLSTTLHDLKQLTVVTNSITVANELMYHPHIEVRVCGGIIRSDKGSLIGPQAEAFFENIYLDKAFIGADAISPNFGTSSLNTYISHLERIVMGRARETFILADHTKFTRGTSSVDLVASFDEVDHIVTDSMVEPSILVELKKMGVHVIEANPLQKRK